MTQNRTRKTAAKKAVSKDGGEAKAASTDPQPMDTTAIATSTPTAPVTQRPAYAAVRLVDEVKARFPEVVHEYSAPGQFRVMLDVSFDTTSLDDANATMLADLLMMAQSDRRVREVLVEEGQVLVSLLSHPVLQETRAPFGLAEAHDILMEKDQ